MDKYECPETESFQLFPKLCTKHGECITEMGSDHRCCKQYGNRRCVKATARYIAEPKHSRWFFHYIPYNFVLSLSHFNTALLGIIPRKCPKEPLAELFWQLHTCESDQDCWPRICCPDGAYKYCRTSTPELEKSNYRVAKQLATRKYLYTLIFLLSRENRFWISVEKFYPHSFGIGITVYSVYTTATRWLRQVPKKVQHNVWLFSKCVLSGGRQKALSTTTSIATGSCIWIRFGELHAVL